MLGADCCLFAVGVMLESDLLYDGCCSFKGMTGLSPLFAAISSYLWHDVLCYVSMIARGFSAVCYSRGFGTVIARWFSAFIPGEEHVSRRQIGAWFCFGFFVFGVVMGFWFCFCWVVRSFWFCS